VPALPFPNRCGLALVAAALALPAGAGEVPKQQVLISFDGANDNALWERSLALGEKTGARFTYFLSCVYLLSPDRRTDYAPPGMRPGRSNVGFGQSGEDVRARLVNIWRAHNRGHEIAGHGCGHFDGADWSRADWAAEFSEFARILRDAWSINGLGEPPAGWRHMAASVTGFRAPYLSVGKHLDEALAEAGYRYDASAVSRGPATPHAEGGLVRFALPLVPEGPAGRRIIAMDYNLFVRHSGGLERPSDGAVFEERAYRAFRQAFDAEHRGERRPLQMGFHFTLMNGGAYWRALERFAGEVCVMDDVACTTHRSSAAAIAPAEEQSN
jgi:peptidoglycan/xylan/chitin deacetylase (PgdA/CDA1 family)